MALMLKQILLAGSAAVLVSAYALPAAYAQQSNSQQPVSAQTVDAFVQQYDTDHDGSLDLDEANKAATARFAILDTDHDGTVDQKEIVPAGVSDEDFKAVDPDNDKLLQKDEYMKLVKQKFDAADTDHDNTLTKQELNSQAGQALMRLLQ